MGVAINLLLVLLAIAAGGDTYTSWQALHRDRGGAEAQPLIGWLIHAIGLPLALLAAKLVMLFAVGFMAKNLEFTGHARLAVPLVAVACLTNAWVVVHNMGTKAYKAATA